MKHSRHPSHSRPAGRGVKTPAHTEGSIQAYLQARELIRRSKLTSLFVGRSSVSAPAAGGDTDRFSQ